MSVNLDRDRTTRRLLIFWTIFTILGFVLVAGFAFGDDSLALSGDSVECAIPEGCDPPETVRDITRQNLMLIVYIALIVYYATLVIIITILVRSSKK